MWTIVKKNPFVTYATIGFILVIIVNIFSLQYDERGIRGALFWTSQVFAVWLWIPGEALRSLFPNIDSFLRDALTLALGGVMCMLLDIAWRAWWSRRGQEKPREP